MDKPNALRGFVVSGSDPPAAQRLGLRRPAWRRRRPGRARAAESPAGARGDPIFARRLREKPRTGQVKVSECSKATTVTVDTGTVITDGRH
jgi:hypothetical protein